MDDQIDIQLDRQIDRYPSNRQRRLCGLRRFAWEPFLSIQINLEVIPFIHQFIHPLIHPPFHPSMFLTIYTFTLPCSYPYILYPSMFLSIYTFTLPFSYPYILSPFHVLIHIYFHPSILSPFHTFTLIHSSIHPFIHLRLAMFVQTIFIQTLRDYGYSDLKKNIFK